MAYTRKTRDYWDIQQYTGPQYGWETVSACGSWKEARQELREYRENQPEYPVRARRKRERIVESATVICDQCGQSFMNCEHRHPHDIAAGTYVQN